MALFKAVIAFGVIAVSLSQSTGGPWGGHGGHMKGPMGGPFAELEKSLTDDQKTQLKAIFENDSATKQQIQDNVAAFFQGIGGDVATKYTEMKTQMDAKKAEMASKSDESTSNLSEAAKAVLSQAKALKENMTLTPAQEREQTKALFDGASDEVKAELKSAMPKGEFGGRGPRFTTVAA